MKTRQFKHLIFALSTLLVFTISFNSCSDDDDDNSSDARAFLELYEGTTWELNDDGGVVEFEEVPAYFRFVNDATNVIDGWYRVSNNEEFCYYNILGINLDNGDMTLVGKSENKIVIKITYTDETETYTVTIQGDILTIVMVYKEEGWPAETYTLYFDKTTVNVDALPLCPL